jgi:hypothetical protein
LIGGIHHDRPKLVLYHGCGLQNISIDSRGDDDPCSEKAEPFDPTAPGIVVDSDKAPAARDHDPESPINSIVLPHQVTCCRPVIQSMRSRTRPARRSA